MKIAIIHLSDFHIKTSDIFKLQKIDGISSALNTIGKVDDYIIVFSGDLAFSGNPNEYKKSRVIFGKLISEIKEKNDNNYVNLFMVPGNHDLYLPKNARNRNSIQKYYDEGIIEQLIPEEETYLNNFYLYSRNNGSLPNDIILNKTTYQFKDYKIQFNLINTALFSTLEPNDKELHYFPNEKMHLLKKSDDSDLCITVMHHSCEWFNWNYKSTLEKAITKNSELLFYGHDHCDHTATLSIDNGPKTWISSAGEINFSSCEEGDSFNTIVIDTNLNCFDGYMFSWNKFENIYTHTVFAEQEKLQIRSNIITPSQKFLEEMKYDTYSLADDFTNYFVFPKLIAKSQNEFDKNLSITTLEKFNELLEKKNKLLITGPTNSGKTTLLKYLYFEFLKSKAPLFISSENKHNIKSKNFIKHLFEEQYEEDSLLFEKFLQLNINERVLIIDGWDSLNIKDKSPVIESINNTFGYVIISGANSNISIIDNVKENIGESSNYFELHIKPFFAEKRNELVKNICKQNNILCDNEISNINRLIDALVQNNNGLFSLNPAFIVKYTKFFLEDPYQDYTKGEAIFSKVFETDLNRSIINYAKKQTVDEVLIAFEEIAGYMFKNMKDELSTVDINNAIECYNTLYGEHINAERIVDIGLKSKVFARTDEFKIYFSNKNHLSYFIAKYLIRLSQSEPADISGIEYALKNICFGINSDIILFISYLSTSTKIITNISKYAGELLESWDTIDLYDKNISLLHNVNFDQVSPPSEAAKKQHITNKEKNEERNHSEDIITSIGAFDYDVTNIDNKKYMLIRALKYTEMICKALPAFHGNLKLEQKNALVESIYLYPRKIVFALLKPVDENLNEICNDILTFTRETNKVKPNGEEYTKDDIIELINDSARATMLSIFDHFSELATSYKTIELLLNKPTNDFSEKIEQLMMIENTGNTDNLLRTANLLIKEKNGIEYDIMVKLIVRKHLLTNNLPSNKKQKVIDTIFGKKYRKDFLLLQ